MGNQYLDLSIAPADTAFGLMADFDADPHPSKVSLIAGAYRDEIGKPWVLPSVEKVIQQNHCNKRQQLTTSLGQGAPQENHPRIPGHSRLANIHQLGKRARLRTCRIQPST